MSEALLNKFLEMEDALSDLGKYRDYMAPSGHSDFAYPHAEHHSVMARALERIADGNLKRLIIQLPPGAAKSTITSIQFATWYWAKNPTHHVLRCSATDSLARKFARRNLATVMTPQWQMLAETKLHAKIQAADHFANEEGGTMTAAGVGASIIGLRSHLSILDDPVASFEQINSDTQRQAQLDWYFAEYRSRIIPGGAEVIVTTRWHPKDIVGYILDSEEADTWEVIRIPMVCDSDDDPLGRQIGERLWTEWFTEQMVQEAQRDPLRWAGMYQQKPVSDKGDWLKAEDIEIVDRAPLNLGIYAGLDIAMSEGKGDFSVCVVGGMSDDGYLYILDLLRVRVTPDRLLDSLIALHQEYNIREVLIDDDAGAKVFRNLAHKVLMQRGAMLPLVPIPTRGQNKEVRAMAFRGLAKMGGVKIVKNAWNVDLLREISEFPFGNHDDIVDALSLLGRRAAKMSPGPVTHTEHKASEGLTLDALWEEKENANWQDHILRI